MREWRYKTAEAGRPRRFFSHREAAWWAAARVGPFFLPILPSRILWVLLGFGAPYPWRIASSVGPR